MDSSESSKAPDAGKASSRAQREDYEAPAEDYEAPAIESVQSPADMDREVHYAGLQISDD